MIEASLQIGPITIGLYGVMITLGVIAAITLSGIEAKRRGQATEHLLNMALIVLPLGIIGARLYHVIDEWSFYSQNPALIIGGRGLGIFGAVIGGAVGLIVYTKWKKLGTLTWMDIVAPGLILAQAIGRWGNFFNQELYGPPADLPWAIYIDPAHRIAGYEAFSHFHPLFLYESIWNALGCIMLLLVGRRFRLLSGDIFFLYVIYYSVGRFFLEGLKIDVWTVSGIPTARWIAGIAIFASIAVMACRRYRASRNSPSRADSL
jgi:phosphatidylglycerol---prolipoprotein diacylglyceryl transferase